MSVRCLPRSAALACALAVLVPWPALTRAAAPPAGLHPPFRKVWELRLDEQLESMQVTPRAIYFGTFHSYGAADPAAGRLKWSRKFPDKQFGAQVTVDGPTMYVAIGQGSLLACDAATGRERWRLPLRGYASPLKVVGRVLYCGLQPDTLAALDLGTRKPMWTVRLAPPPKKGDGDRRYTPAPLVLGDRLVVASTSGPILCLDRRTGRVVWRGSYPVRGTSWVSGMAADANRIYCCVTSGIVLALDHATGRQVWVRPDMGWGSRGAPVLLGGTLVLTGSSDGVARGLDPATGRTRWERRLSTERDPDVSPPLVVGGTVLTTAGSRLFALSPGGQVLWQWDTEERLFGESLGVLGRDLLVPDAHRFIRLAMGAPPALPTGSTARLLRAKALAVRFDALTEDQKRELVKLAPESFDALLPFLKLRLAAYTELSKAKAKDSFKAYSRFSDMAEVMQRAMRPQHTRAVLALLPTARGDDGSAPGVLLGMLAAHGDPALTTPVFVDILRKQRGGWGYAYSASSLALQAVTHTSDSRAVRFLLDALADPRAESEVRHEAFIALARTGGRAGLEAVLAARDTGRTLRPLPDAMELGRVGTEPDPRAAGASRLLAVHKDAAGTTWGLLGCPVLGSLGDLWIVRRDGDRWTSPQFTGVDTASERAFSRSGRQPFRYQGLTAKQIVDGAWVKLFVGNAALARDTDGDGWTDLVEARVGTDPHKADTDGDGLKDGVDRCPLAAPRKLNEEEQVLRAAFEGRFRFEGERLGPCVVDLPAGMAPFELAGYDGIVATVTGERGSPLDALYGEGVGMVRFGAPAYDLQGAAVNRGRDNHPVLWSPDRTRAKVGISVYYGGLNGTVYDITLRKFGQDWVVVDAVMTAIS